MLQAHVPRQWEYSSYKQGPKQCATQTFAPKNTNRMVCLCLHLGVAHRFSRCEKNLIQSNSARWKHTKNGQNWQNVSISKSATMCTKAGPSKQYVTYPLRQIFSTFMRMLYTWCSPMELFMAFYSAFWRLIRRAMQRFRHLRAAYNFGSFNLGNGCSSHLSGSGWRIRFIFVPYSYIGQICRSPNWTHFIDSISCAIVKRPSIVICCTHLGCV